MLQSSLELRKASPSCGGAPPLSAAPGPWLGAGKAEKEAAAHGAWCRLLLSWRGSKSNILQGCYFPCSAHAQFKRPLCSSKRASGLLFLMHTVKGKKITVIHLFRACGRQNFSFFQILHHRKDHHFRVSTSSPFPTGPLCPRCTGAQSRQLQ